MFPLDFQLVKLLGDVCLLAHESCQLSFDLCFLLTKVLHVLPLLDTLGIFLGSSKLLMQALDFLKLAIVPCFGYTGV